VTRRLTRWPHFVAHGCDRGVAIERCPMRAGLAQRVVHVGRGQQPRRHRERVPRQPVRIAASVESLVMLRRARHDRRQRRDPGEHPTREVRVGPRPFLLRERPRPGRVPDRAGHPDHADIVDRTRAPQVRGVGICETEVQRRFTGELGDAARMADAQR
jgi:hypothetical protein